MKNLNILADLKFSDRQQTTCSPLTSNVKFTHLTTPYLAFLKSSKQRHQQNFEEFEERNYLLS